MPVSINGSGSITGVSSLTQLTKLGVTGILTATDFSGPSGGAADFPNGLTATTASFSGNLSVGGVLTYDDVTNIDSVGVITARSDVSIADKIIHTGDTNTAIRFPAADTFSVETGGSERLRIDSNGNIGVGVNNPSSFNSDGRNLVVGTGSGGQGISIYSANNSYGTIYFADGTSGSELYRGGLLYNHASDFLRFDTAGAEKVRITSDGDVGIGDNAPNSSYGTNLSVHSTATNGARLKLSDGSTGKGNTDGLDIISTGSVAYFINRENADMSFSTNNIERLRILTDGKIRVPDNGKLTLGAGDDLQIWSDNTDQYIRGEQNQLIVRSNNLKLQSYLGENYIHCAMNNAVSLYYNNSKKLETISSGAKITGVLEVTQEYPTIRPTLDLNFAATKTLDRRITFTRDSIGTYTDDMGIVKYASNNVPRFDHNFGTGESLGLLIEESRTNLIPYSEDFNNAAWTKRNISFTSNVATAPDGNTTADKIVPNSGSVYPADIYDSFTITTPLTLSLWAKADGFNVINLNLANYGDNGVEDAFLKVNVNTGALVENTGSAGGFWTSYSITPHSNGWYRITATTTDTTDGNAIVQFQVCEDDGSLTVTSGNGVKGILIWGAQLEAGSFPTSYIPTSGSTVTRAADYAKITGTNFTDFYNQNEGTFFIDSAVARGSAYHGYVGSTTNSTANGGPSYNFNSLMSDGDNSDILLNIWDGTGGTQAMIAIAHPSGNMKAAGAFKNNDFALSMNGSAVSTDTSGTIDTNQDQLWIGRRSYADAGWLNNSIKRVVYYNKRLPNAQLQGLTQQ